MPPIGGFDNATLPSRVGGRGDAPDGMDGCVIPRSPLPPQNRGSPASPPPSRDEPPTAHSHHATLGAAPPHLSPAQRPVRFSIMIPSPARGNRLQLGLASAVDESPLSTSPQRQQVSPPGRGGWGVGRASIGNSRKHTDAAALGHGRVGIDRGVESLRQLPPATTYIRRRLTEQTKVNIRTEPIVSTTSSHPASTINRLSASSPPSVSLHCQPSLSLGPMNGPWRRLLYPHAPAFLARHAISPSLLLESSFPANVRMASTFLPR